jgi:hypothetical protein
MLGEKDYLRGVSSAYLEAYMVTLIAAGLVMVIGGVIALIARPQVADPVYLRVRPRHRR